ncbi:MAG: NifU family protein [bacterium]
MEDKIKQALEQVRPGLLADGGDVEFVSFDPSTGIVELKLLGACSSCPMSQITLRWGIEETIKLAVPEVKEVTTI